MLTIYHNPRCSKSREALALLNEQQCNVKVIEYLKTPLTAPELSSLLKKLGMTARQLIRTKEDEYQSLGLADSALSEQQLILAMAKHPKLIERPIVTNGDQAVVARPAENILTILS